MHTKSVGNSYQLDSNPSTPGRISRRMLVFECRRNIDAMQCLIHDPLVRSLNVCPLGLARARRLWLVDLNAVYKQRALVLRA